MFREINEVKRGERIRQQLERERKEREMCENGFLKIKAGTEMNAETARNIWSTMFANMGE